MDGKVRATTEKIENRQKLKWYEKPWFKIFAKGCNVQRCQLGTTLYGRNVQTLWGTGRTTLWPGCNWFGQRNQFSKRFDGNSNGNLYEDFEYTSAKRSLDIPALQATSDRENNRVRRVRKNAQEPTKNFYQREALDKTKYITNTASVSGMHKRNTNLLQH